MFESGSKKQVLIIEPDALRIADLERIFMLEPEFSVDATISGSEGYQKAKEKQPSFVIISDTIADVNFFTLLSALLTDAPYSKRVVLLKTENPLLKTHLTNNFKVSVILTQAQVAERLVVLLRSVEANSFHQNITLNPQGAHNPQEGQSPLQQPLGNNQGSFGFPQQGNQFPQNPFPAPQQPMGGNFPYQGGGYPSQQPLGNNQGSFGFSQQGNQFPQNPFPVPQQPMGGNFPYQGGGLSPQQPQQSWGGVQANFPPPQQVENMPSEERPFHRGIKTLKQVIIAVNCPKGGVGKSTISKELALAYASVRINGQPLKVCLVDCDFDFGDIASMLKMPPNVTVSNWMADIRQRQKTGAVGLIKYSQPQIEKFLLTHKVTGLKVLAAPIAHHEAADITEQVLETIIENLKACDFDVIILDTANNMYNNTMIALEKATAILLIATMDVATLQDTSSMLATLKSIDFRMDKIKLIMNRMPKGEGQDISLHDISGTLGIPILDTIPEYGKIRNITNHGNAAVLDRETEFSVAIRRLGDHFFPVFNKAISPRGTEKKSQSIISKLFAR